MENQLHPMTRSDDRLTVPRVVETPQLDRREHAPSRTQPTTAFALVVVALNGLALTALWVIATNERLLQMIGAFATSLFFLILGALGLWKLPRHGLTPEASGVARAGAVSVAASLVILASGVVVSHWIGPTYAEFIRQESTRDAAASWCWEPVIDGHVVGDVCRRQGEDLFRLPPAPIDWTFDEEGG
jgi:hypothetical protein